MSCSAVWQPCDKAPLHYGHSVRGYLHEYFSSHWTGCSGPQVWPLRSSDLTLPYYFLWGHMKSLVYKQRLTQELQCFTVLFSSTAHMELT